MSLRTTAAARQNEMKASMAVVATRTVAAGRTALARDESVFFDAMGSYEAKKFTVTTLEEWRKCAIRKASRFHKDNFGTLKLSTTYGPQKVYDFRASELSDRRRMLR